MGVTIRDGAEPARMGVTKAAAGGASSVASAADYAADCGGDASRLRRETRRQTWVRAAPHRVCRPVHSMSKDPHRGSRPQANHFKKRDRTLYRIQSLLLSTFAKRRRTGRRTGKRGYAEPETSSQKNKKRRNGGTAFFQDCAWKKRRADARNCFRPIIGEPQRHRDTKFNPSEFSVFSVSPCLCG